MRRILRIFTAECRLVLAILTEYRAAVYIWMIAGTLPLLMMVVWRHVAENEAVGGFNAEDFARYFLIGFLVHQCVQAWVVWEFDEKIRSGTLSVQLLRPVDPYVGQAAENLVGNAFRLPAVLPVTFGGLYLTGALDGLAWHNLPQFLLALAGAWGIKFNMHYCLGLLALWTDRAKSLDPWAYLMMEALGGGMFPLDLLPPWLRTLVDLTPFPFIINFPVTVLTRSPDWASLAGGLAAQAFWTAAFVLLHRLMWRSGRKRFGAVGG